MNNGIDISHQDVKTAVEVYTDGSARRQDLGGGYPGGFAFVCMYAGSRIEKYGWANSASSNQMELSAILAALIILKPVKKTVIIYSDSNYAIKAITKWSVQWRLWGWTTAIGQPVKNRDLIEAILAAIERHDSRGAGVQFKHVRGHAGVDENERADALAGRARLQRICNIKTPMKLPGLDFHHHQPVRRKCPTL